MEVLARIFEPELSIFVSDIDGLYLSDPKKDPDAEFIPEVTEETLERISSEQSADDVTGGVAGKMRSMLSMCAEGRECILLNGTVPGRLLSALNGEKIRCTTARV
jgi:isopentenyl phosphate kinase